MSAQQNQALTAEQIVEELKRKHAEESALGRVPKSVKLIAAATACGIVLSIVGIGTAGDLAVANAQKLADAEAAYSEAAQKLDSMFDANHSAAAQLAADVDRGLTVVDTTTQVTEAVNGFVDPAALTQLATHTVELSTVVNTQAGASARTYENPKTLEQYRDARALAIAQTRINRDALNRTEDAISDVSSKILETTDDVKHVAATVQAIAPQVLAANTHAHSDTQTELTATVADIQTALTDGGDLTEKLTTYGAVARAVQASNSDYTGKPPVQVVASITIPKPPTTMTPASQVRNDTKPSTHNTKTPVATTPAPPGSASTKPPTPSAPSTSPSGPSANNAPSTPSTKPAPSQAPPAPANPAAAPPAPAPPKQPFNIAFNTNSNYTPGCQRTAPIGGGVAYGPAGTTKSVALIYPMKYTYTVSMTSATSGAWIVYACKVDKPGKSDQSGSRQTQRLSQPGHLRQLGRG